jgi:hypothetical protein
MSNAGFKRDGEDRGIQYKIGSVSYSWTNTNYCRNVEFEVLKTVVVKKILASRV